MMLYICIAFSEYSLNALLLWSRQDLHTYDYKGHNSIKTVKGVAVFVLCTSSDDALHIR